MFQKPKARQKNTIEVESDIKVDNDIIVNKVDGTPAENYDIKKKLGEGSYGVVWRVEHKQTGLCRAMKKIIKNPRAKKDSETEILNEINILKKMDHPNIVKIYEIIDAEEHDYLYIILELADLGQLAKWDFEKELYVRNDKICECIMRNIIENEQALP